MSRRLVIGVGHPDCGDDAVGRMVVGLLRGKLPTDVELEEHSGEAATLVDRLDGASSVYLVDAAVSGAERGRIRRIEANDGPLPSGLGSMSSHGLGVAESIELARALAMLPPICAVFAIEAGTFEPGAVPSPEVERAAHEVADAILRELTADQD